uniref:Uncharacterized protein n=1 Tax=Ananas comosus var. bracteatus TaxID=296719 RepID=A0A6V7P1Z4_ANACO|nr:unnamed protein product [Ananas comosus var. bracteatus]
MRYTASYQRRLEFSLDFSPHVNVVTVGNKNLIIPNRSAESNSPGNDVFVIANSSKRKIQVALVVVSSFVAGFSVSFLISARGAVAAAKLRRRCCLRRRRALVRPAAACRALVCRGRPPQPPPRSRSAGLRDRHRGRRAAQEVADDPVHPRRRRALVRPAAARRGLVRRGALPLFPADLERGGGGGGGADEGAAELSRGDGDGAEAFSAGVALTAAIGPKLLRSAGGGGIGGLVDPRLGAEYDAEEAAEMVKMAAACVAGSPSLRPSMAEILPTISNLQQLAFIALQHNKFNGSIPYSVNGLESLNELYLGSNYFNGSIPSSLGDLRYLEILDLSYNNFSGNVPDSLSFMNRLTEVVLSYNNLSGHLDLSRFLSSANVVTVGNKDLIVLKGSAESNSPENGVFVTNDSSKRKILVALAVVSSFVAGFSVSFFMSSLTWKFLIRKKQLMCKMKTTFLT